MGLEHLGEDTHAPHSGSSTSKEGGITLARVNTCPIERPHATERKRTDGSHDGVSRTMGLGLQQTPLSHVGQTDNRDRGSMHPEVN